MAGEVVACPGCNGRFQIAMPTARPMGFSGSSTSNLPDEVRHFVEKKVVAGILGILFGAFGVHKFILGLNTAGTVMLVVSITGVVAGGCIVVPILATMAMSIIGLIEGIIYLTKPDEDFYRTYAIQKKEWF